MNSLNSRYVQLRESMSYDGLGVPALSIYFSYCDKQECTGYFCNSCQNKELQKDGEGYLINYKNLLSLVQSKLEAMSKIFDDVALVFLGGEPLAKINRAMVFALSKYFKSKSYSTLVYIWRAIEDLKKESIDLTYYDRIVCGEYLENSLDENYVLGSTNQYVIDNKCKKIIKY